MEGTQPHIIPSIYLANYLNDFEELMVKYGAREEKIEKGSYLTQYGVINNTAYYVKKGIIHLSLGHEQGRKSLNMFGPGTIFPVGVELHEFRVEYEMSIQVPQEVRIYYRNGKTELLEIPGTENNMVYEAREFLRLIEEKDYNHKYLENSRLEMELMDEVRRQQEIVFPADEN